MSITFNPTPYGTPLTNLKSQLPQLTYGLGTRVLVYNTFTDFFPRFGKAYGFFASGCIAVIAAAATIRDIPQIVWGVEQLALGRVSLFDNKTRAILSTHITSYYLWPIGVNLIRLLFISAIGTVLTTGFLTIWYHRSRVKTFAARRNEAIEHLKVIQTLADKVLKLIPDKDPKTHLTEALNLFASNLEEKRIRLNQIICILKKNSATSSFDKDEEVSPAFFKKLRQAVIQQLDLTNIEKSYSTLKDIFVPTKETSGTAIDHHLETTLETSWRVGDSPVECLDLLLKSFQEPKFDETQDQVLEYVREGVDPAALKVYNLYRSIHAHKKAYNEAIAEMQTIYGFTKPEIDLDKLWKPPQ